MLAVYDILYHHKGSKELFQSDKLRWKDRDQYILVDGHRWTSSACGIQQTITDCQAPAAFEYISLGTLFPQISSEY